MLYLIQLSLEKFVDALTPGSTCFVQAVGSTTLEHGIAVAKSHKLILTAPVVVDGLALVQGVSVPIETVSLVVGHSDVRDSLTRVDQVLERIRTIIESHGSIVRDGIVFVPNMRVDLDVYTASQNIWRIVKEDEGNRHLQWL